MGIEGFLEPDGFLEDKNDGNEDPSKRPNPRPTLPSIETLTGLPPINTFTKYLDGPSRGQLSEIVPGLQEMQNRNQMPNSNVQGLSTKVKLPKRFFCKTCKQGFTRKHNMVSHELIHSSLKPHICLVCNLKFRRIHDLKRHEKLHTGEKPYFCERCSRRFARPDALTRHQHSANGCTIAPSRLDGRSTPAEFIPKMNGLAISKTPYSSTHNSASTANPSSSSVQTGSSSTSFDRQQETRTTPPLPMVEGTLALSGNPLMLREQADHNVVRIHSHSADEMPLHYNPYPEFPPPYIGHSGHPQSNSLPNIQGPTALHPVPHYSLPHYSYAQTAMNNAVPIPVIHNVGPIPVMNNVPHSVPQMTHFGQVVPQLNNVPHLKNTHVTGPIQIHQPQMQDNHYSPQAANVKVLHHSPKGLQLPVPVPIPLQRLIQQDSTPLPFPPVSIPPPIPHQSNASGPIGPHQGPKLNNFVPVRNNDHKNSPQGETTIDGYVLYSKYQDLASYTHSLKNDLVKMNNRLSHLERDSKENNKQG